MERSSEAEAANSSEQVELELESLTANDDHSSPCEDENTHHEQDEGNAVANIKVHEHGMVSPLPYVIVDADDEKPPAYDNLNDLAQQELPTVQKRSNTFIGESGIDGGIVI